MRAGEAIAHVNSLVTRPGYCVSAVDYCHRFEDCILVTVKYEARQSGQEHAPDYRENIEGGASASFPLLVGALDRYGVDRAVLDALASVDSHEQREFLRHGDTLEAPFHPHTLEGVERWGDPNADLLFGVG